jgi:hypothetical protein
VLACFALGGLLAFMLLPVASYAAKADLTHSHTKELASPANERFKLPDPMSLEYFPSGRLRDTARETEAPTDNQSPAKTRPKPETN